MMARKLPIEDKAKIENIIERFNNGERGGLAEELGYTNPDSLVRALRRIGIRVKPSTKYEIKKGEVERNPIVELPPINLRTYKAPKRKRGDEEIAILHASDGHADKITKSYNKEVYRERMWKMFESAMTIINLHRNLYPIRKLVIFDTGDNIQGENPYQGSTAGAISMGARDQVKTLAAPMWNDVIGSFKQEFEEVEFHGIPGNHGHDKLAPMTSSYDLLLYDILETGIGKQRGININVHDEQYAIVELLGFRHFLFHGDSIPCPQGVPYFAIDKKLKSWYMQLGGFRYAWSGHFHKSLTGHEVSSVLEHFMAASLVSHDDWALMKLGISSNPSQGIYGLHPRRGVTWRYSLTVDEDFLPDKETRETNPRGGQPNDTR